MGAEENGGGKVGSSPSSSSSSSQRQRFYVELIPGQTTIVSWKKLLREAKEKDQCPPPPSATFMGPSRSGTQHSSSAQETPKRPLDDSSEVGQFSDSFVRSERPEHNSGATSSGYQQQRKRRVEMPKVEGDKNDDPSCAKHLRLEKMSVKATDRTSPLFDKPSSPSSMSAVTKDHRLDGPQASAAGAPVLMYTKKSAGKTSKYGCPSPPNAIKDTSVFPLKTKLHNTEKICSEKSRMEVKILGNSSDAVHENSAFKGFALQTSPRSRNLMERKKIEVCPKSQHNEKSGGSKELLDFVPPGYKSKSSLQHSKGASSAVDDEKPAWTFSTVLERAIRELEETVAESKSFNVEASDAKTSWLTIERELPLEVKLKLGKVAKIVQSSQEIISEDLVTCLVSIIGKLVRGNSVKRILRRLVMLKLSARMEKVEKFKEIKDELLAMVANLSPIQQTGASGNPEAKEEVNFAATYKIDCAIEDKLCDLYDLCVQGLGRHKGAEVQKLFVELAELWPKGVMDHHKLRDAISRAKSRRVLADRNQGQMVVQSGPGVEDNVNRNGDLVTGLSRKVYRSSGASNKLVSPQSGKTAARKPKSVEHNSSIETNLTNSATMPRLKEQKKQVPEKKNVKIRFSLKPQDGTNKPEEQVLDNKFNRPTAAAPMTCKQKS